MCFLKKDLKLVSSGTLPAHRIARAVYRELMQTAPLSAEVVFVSADEIRALNNEKRGVDAVTDVLSFPSLDGVRGKVLKCADYPYECENGRLFLGSVALCPARAKEQAKEYGHSEKREYVYLVVHGLLHLFGYDHEDANDKKEMRAHEKRIVKALGLSEGDEE